MTSTNDLPLAAYILQPPQQEMIEPSNLLDLSENRFWQLNLRRIRSAIERH